MGGTESKQVDANGVIVNDIEIIEAPKTTNILLLILVLISIGEIIYKILSWHRQSLKRKYLKRAVSVDQV